jgi:hypothetical protein
VQPPGCTLEQYSAAKRLPIEFLRELGLSDTHVSGMPALRIPYRDGAGEEVAVRLRLGLEKSASGDGRFRWRSGDRAQPYGLWLLDRARTAGYLVLVEGESDAHTLWRHDFPALGIPGATTWREDWAGRLDGIATVYVCRATA